jgi:multidrug efflux pump subunit AcrB
MTSISTLSSTVITIQFDLDRDINADANDVQAAINAAAARPRGPCVNEVAHASSLQRPQIHCCING